jgi:hypothetical protein
VQIPSLFIYIPASCILILVSTMKIALVYRLLVMIVFYYLVEYT